MKLINELTESHLITSKTGYRKYSGKQIAEILYLNILAFRILTCDDKNTFIETYANKTKYFRNFDDWHQNTTDLYLLVFGLLTEDDISLSKDDLKYLKSLSFDTDRFMNWLKMFAAHSPLSETHAMRLFMSLDKNLKITNDSWRSIRRLAMNWPHITHYDRQLAMTRLLQLMRSRCPTSDLIAPLDKFAKKHDLELDDVCNPEETNESMTLMQVAAHHQLAEDGDAAPSAATTTSDIATYVKPFMKVRRRNAK